MKSVSTNMAVASRSGKPALHFQGPLQCLTYAVAYESASLSQLRLINMYDTVALKQMRFMHG